MSISCRFCFADDANDLFSPCQCKGTISKIHRNCLNQWLQQNPILKCQTCNFNYRVQNETIFIADQILIILCIDILWFFACEFVTSNLRYAILLLWYSQMPIILFYLFRSDENWKRNIFLVLLFSSTVTWIIINYQKAQLYDEIISTQKIRELNHDDKFPYWMKILSLGAFWFQLLLFCLLSFDYFSEKKLTHQKIILAIDENSTMFSLLWRIFFIFIILIEFVKIYLEFSIELFKE